MTNKFTEEQYKRIVEIADDFEENGGLGILDTLNSLTIADRLLRTHLAVEIEFHPNSGIIMALANPLTREWAHDKFVEKEKKYYWNSNKTDLSGNHLRLYRHEKGGVASYSRFEPANNINEDEQLTETEIKKWGYNPEMFDREEV